MLYSVCVTIMYTVPVRLVARRSLFSFPLGGSGYVCYKLDFCTK